MKKIFFQKYHKKAEIHSFPTMYIKGGLPLVEVSQNEDFVQKTASKTAFLSITIPDQLTLSSHNSCSKPLNHLILRAVIRAFLVSFCQSVPPEFLRSFLHLPGALYVGEPFYRPTTTTFQISLGPTSPVSQYSLQITTKWSMQPRAVEHALCTLRQHTFVKIFRHAIVWERR